MLTGALHFGNLRQSCLTLSPSRLQSTSERALLPITNHRRQDICVGAVLSEFLEEPAAHAAVGGLLVLQQRDDGRNRLLQCREVSDLNRDMTQRRRGLTAHGLDDIRRLGQISEWPDSPSVPPYR